jgi:pSer/pThr/pTyr-binding forkhead associated (FHA) protein
MTGKVIGLKTGETVTVGRAAGRAQFALPHDTFMSGVHFAVECRPGGCRVQDRQSSNGTFLNGARIQDAMLANGDEIKGGQTVFAVKIVTDVKLASLMPPQEVAPRSTSQQWSRAADPVAPSAPEQRHPADAPSPPQQRPRAADPELPAAHASRPLAAVPAPPQMPSAARLEDEPKLAPVKGTPEPSPPARVPVGEPPSPVMRMADLDDGAESRPTPDAAVEAAAQKFEPGAEPAARKFSGTLEPPAAGGLPPKAVLPKSAPPPVEEPPRFHAIPTPPGGGAKEPHAAENPSRTGERSLGENPPGFRAKPLRVSEPPAGVAPYILQKFAEPPASRGAGIPRGAAFSVMGWSFPAAPAEWLVQEGFGLQQSGHEEFPSSVAATEELLGGITLQQFVESQISMLRGYLRDPKIEPTMPPRVGGADESMAMDVRHSTKDGRELVYRRIYARSGSSVGVLTVTTLATDLPRTLQSLQPLLEGASFRATVKN